MKKTGTENFDVPMDCYDAAEVCELVGCYILNQLSTVMRNELVGLYRDDGLDIMKKNVRTRNRVKTKTNSKNI